MKAEEMRKISVDNQPWIHALDNARQVILKNAQEGEYKCRHSCDENYEMFIFDALRKDGYNVRGVLREAGRVIYEISWE